MNICYPVQLADTFSKRSYLTAMGLDPVSIYRVSSTGERCTRTHYQYQSVCSPSYSFVLSVEQRSRNCQLKGSLSKLGHIKRTAFPLWSIPMSWNGYPLVRHWVPRVFEDVVFCVPCILKTTFNVSWCCVMHFESLLKSTTLGL